MLVGIVLALSAGLSWLNRRTLAREALTGWLTARGIASEAEVYAVGPTTFAARLRIGDPGAPDFNAERVEVRYRARLSGLEIISVTLTKPVLRASLKGGRFSVGALDPIVTEMLRRPAPPKAPRFVVEGGRLLLGTEAGPVDLTADAVMADNRLVSLRASTAPMRLKRPGLDVAAGAGALTLVTRGGRMDLSLTAPIAVATASGKTGAVRLREARATLTAEAPYPDLARASLSGPLSGRVQLTAGRVESQGRSLDGVDMAAAFRGQVRGGVSDLALSGSATADLLARTGAAAGLASGRLRVTASAPDLRWTRRGGDEVAGTARIGADLDRVTAAALRLSALSLSAAGPVSVAQTKVTTDLMLTARGRGAWDGLGAPASADAPEMLALRRAARSFAFTAAAVKLQVDDGVAVGLPQPVRLVSDSGVAASLSGARGQPVVGPGGGAFQFTAVGGGLPRLDADVSRLTLSDDGAIAEGRVRVAGSFGVVRDADLDASGQLRIGGGDVSFAGARCAAVNVRRLEFGVNDIEALAGRLCAVRFRMQDAGWSLAARAEGLSAAAPFAQVRVDRGALDLTAGPGLGGLALKARIGQGRLSDSSPQPRFSPVTLGGDVTLGNFLWRADLSARQPGGGEIGRARLAHDMDLGVGFVVLDTGLLTFKSEGLQPGVLAPAAAALGSPVTGAVRFQGRFDWARDGASSQGSLSIPGLDFQSAAGAVTGLKGEVVFSSLAPLVAAPGQRLDIASIAGIVPITDLHARFELAENLLKIAGGEAVVGGGKVRVESLEYPLTAGAAMRGRLVFDGVQLHDLVEASPFGDKVELDARVSGRVGFEALGSKVRITGGELKAIQPGRISIDRAALTGVKAEGAVSGPAGVDKAVDEVIDPNVTFTDFAYQAMENLAFDTLTATLASRDDSRLGVLFHIVGKHDPPTRQRIRLSVLDLIQRRFLGRTLPLPSGTGVNLTLDTSLNLDDLLADYAEYQRARAGSATVQP